MIRKTCLAVGLGLLLLPPGVRAEEPYTLLLREPAKGDVLQISQSDDTRGHNKLTNAKGDVLVDQDQKSARTTAYRETILEMTEGKAKPAKLKREYEKARVTTGDKTETLPYEGKTVLIERADGKYRFRIEGGGELTGKDAAQLDQEFNKEGEDFDLMKAVLPGKAVAVGESWKLDMGPVAAYFAKSGRMQLDAAKAQGTGKLVKVTTKDGARFGLLEFRLELPIKGTADEKNKVTADAGSLWTVDIASDVCIDGSRTQADTKTDFKIDLNGTLAAEDGTSLKIAVAIKGNSQASGRQVKEK